MGVLVVIEGASKDDARTKVEAYMWDWHPAGYGTTVLNERELDDGHFEVTVWRGSSAD